MSTKENRIADVLSEALVMDAPISGIVGVVEMVQSLAQNTKAIANAITPTKLNGSSDAGDTFVESLTEAVMGQTRGLCRIADAIHDLAEAIREHGGSK